MFASIHSSSTSAFRSLFIAFLVCLTSLPLSAAAVAAAQGQQMLVIYDATFDVGCSLEKQINDGPWQNIPCPAGTVIAVKQVPADEASAYGAAEVIRADVSQLSDSSFVDMQALEYHNALAPAPAVAQSCSTGTRNINGSYGIGGGNKNYYTLSYYMTAYCNVVSVSDRARSDGSSDWIRSCSYGPSSGCYARNISLGYSFTSYYQVPDGDNGSQYCNVATGSGFVTYYGYWYYD